MFANRLQKRFRHLKKWAQRTDVNAFRLYDRDIPEIPLVLDFYGDAAQLKEAALSGALFKRPYEKDIKEEETWLSEMKESAAIALEINPDQIFIKQRQRQKGACQYEKLNGQQFTKIVNENGLAFRVNLSDYLDTGLFTDRRLLRAMVRDEAPGKKILNLFSYTGSFSVYAAAGKAFSTDSVDLSNTYHNWARDNFSLNGLSANIIKNWDYFDHKNNLSSCHCTNNLIRSCVLEFINEAKNAKKRWDIIIIDPPAFSNSKKMTGNFDLNRDLAELLSQCLKLLLPGGKIFVSVNVKRNAPTPEKLKAELKNAQITDLGDKIVDEDFKGKKTPKTFLITLKL